MKQKIILKESELERKISEIIKRVLNEISYNTSKEAFKKAYKRMESGETDREEKQRENLFKHFSERSNKNFDPDMPVVIVGGELEGEYTAQYVVDNFDISGFKKPSPNARYADSKIIGYPKIIGYLGPMWDGDRIRYETQEVNDMLSI